MRIIVCMKQIRYTYARTGMDPVQNFLALEDHIDRVNPYDEVALEFALCCREQLAGAEVFILTLGPLTAEAELRRCLAMGADQLYQIETEPPADTWIKSELLSRAVKDLSADLVLCGKTSLDTGNGQIPAYLAHRLQMPFVSAITKLLILQEDQKLRIQRKASRGSRGVVECSLPAVLSVELGALVPRMPSFANKRRAQSARIETLGYKAEIPLKVNLVQVFPPRPRPKRVPAPDSQLDSFERIDQLLSGSRVQKKGRLLTGSAASQVKAIITFLRAHGFIGLKPKTSEETQKT